MSDFACEKAEDTIVAELIKNTIEEHLLLEFAFEMMLKNLLREPGTQQETLKKIKKTTMTRSLLSEAGSDSEI